MRGAWAGLWRLVAALTLVVSCTRGLSPGTRIPAGRPLTRAERSDYTETSRYADVVAFLDTLRATGAPISIGSLGRSAEGQDIPYVVASRPLARTPDAARMLGRPIVYVNANIHAGEVEGKEAMLALLRDLTLSAHPNVLDSIVLIVVPIYNPDGNDAVAAQSVNRREQNGPEIVGRRENGQRLDLNRDFVKAEAPETRGTLALLNAWDPDVWVDLHTTDGSYHGYALTYAPPLNPSSPSLLYARDTLLPALRERMRERHHLETFDYGNFDLDNETARLTDTVKAGWYTYDDRPRYGTNYVGLRGRLSVLSEAYSHDPFRRRVATTRAFVEEILSYVAEHGAAIRALSRQADTLPLTWARGGPAAQVAIRSELTPTPYTGPVIAEDLVATGDSTRTEPGVPLGIRRTGHFRTVEIPVYDRFTPTLAVTPPAGYLIPARDTAVVALLRLHGIAVGSIPTGARFEVEAFVVDSVARSSRPFQGHHETRVAGRWVRDSTGSIGADAFLFIPTAQARGILAVYLLEPESDDGLVTWNFFDAELESGRAAPVRRVVWR